MKKIITIILTVILCFGLSVYHVEAANIVGNIEAFSIDMSNVENMLKKRRMQEFHIIGDYLYITERFAVDKDNLENDLAIIKMKIIDNTTTNIKDDYMIIRNAGHGETLDAYTYNGNVYFLIGCKAGNNGDFFSTQIGRVEYDAGRIMDYTKVQRLTGFDYANKKSTDNGTVTRVAACCSEKRIKFITYLEKKNKNNNIIKYLQYSNYDLNVVNDIIEKNYKKNELYTSFKNNNSLKKACVNSNLIKRVKGVEELPNESFQGIEAKGEFNYIAGGGSSDTYPIIWKLKNGVKQSSYKILNYTNVDKSVINANNTEIEGLCIVNDELYFALVKSTTEIHIIKTSLTNF